MVSIHDRSPEVAGRLIPDHWEGDLIKGKGNRSAVGTVVERATLFTVLAKHDGSRLYLRLVSERGNWEEIEVKRP
jgi:transposase, IS30 family